MTFSLKSFTVIAALALAGASFGAVEVAAEDSTARPGGATDLRSPSGDGASRPASGSLDLTAGGGSTKVTCCLNWNSDTGGTNCSEVDADECPQGQFKVECGDDGCW